MQNQYKTAFTSKRRRDTASQHEESQGRGSRRTLQHTEEIYNAREVVSTLANAGYELQSNRTDNNWEPLNQVCHQKFLF